MDPAGWRFVGKTGEVKGAGGAAGAIYDWSRRCICDMYMIYIRQQMYRHHGPSE